MKSFLVVVFILLSGISWAQVKIKKSDLVKYEENWSIGVIELMDGTQLKGELWYNQKICVLSFKNNDESQTYTAQTARSFEFDDQVSGRTRKFFSMDTITGRPGFFELLMEFEKFAVLSLNLGLDLAVIQTQYPGNPAANGRYVNLSDREEIYFLTTDGEMSLILVHQANEAKDGVFSFKGQDRDFNMEDFVRIISSPMARMLKNFAKQERLTFRVKSDFLKIMDYYALLVEKQNESSVLEN